LMWLLKRDTKDDLLACSRETIKFCARNCRHGWWRT